MYAIRSYYATCSLLPCENQEQVARFLAADSGFSLLAEQTVSPAASGYDGFYMARLRREG